MDKITNFDKFNAPCLSFQDLPDGMGAEVQVGDTIVATYDKDEKTAEVIEVDKKTERIYLTKELPTEGAEFSVKETATGQEAPYDAMKKGAMQSPDKEILTGPLPALKKFIIQVSVEEGK